MALLTTERTLTTADTQNLINYGLSIISTFN